MKTKENIINLRIMWILFTSRISISCIAAGCQPYLDPSYMPDGTIKFLNSFCRFYSLKTAMTSSLIYLDSELPQLSVVTFNVNIPLPSVMSQSLSQEH